LTVSDEKQARQAHRELAQDAFDFLLDLRRGEPWAAYLARLEGLRLGVDVPNGWVPATFLVAEVDRQIVGRVSIRHQLNPYLAEVAGHIGIGVRPGLRRRGHATAILRQSLAVATSTGLARLLVTCDAHDVGAVSVIENCGGVLEDVAAARRDMHKCRFWVDAGSRAVPPRRPKQGIARADRPLLGRSEATPQITMTAEASKRDSAASTAPVPPPQRSPEQGYHSAMEQGVSLVTLGVADVKRSRTFYERLGWQRQEVDEGVFFRVGNIALLLRGRDKLALDCGFHDEQAGGFSGVLLALNVRSKAEVEAVITSAARAGATVTKPATHAMHGRYAGFFTDPDGHAWEITNHP
jgi:predicted acetyltransferase/predicted lactoylglutathione lyase